MARMQLKTWKIMFKRNSETRALHARLQGSSGNDIDVDWRFIVLSLSCSLVSRFSFWLQTARLAFYPLNIAHIHLSSLWLGCNHSVAEIIRRNDVFALCPFYKAIYSTTTCLPDHI